MHPNMLDFNKIYINKSIVDSALQFDASNLEHTASSVLSQYAFALSQYLVFFRAELNRTKADITQKERLIDSVVSQLLTKELLKQYKTKADAKRYLVNNTEKLSLEDSAVTNLMYEEQLLDGIDKAIAELIASYKRELTRREQELYSTRKDRI